MTLWHDFVSAFRPKKRAAWVRVFYGEWVHREYGNVWCAHGKWYTHTNTNREHLGPFDSLDHAIACAESRVQSKGEPQMSVRFLITEGIFAGWYWRGEVLGKHVAVGLLAHTLQCDQRWIFLLRIGRVHKFGYRTRGDASPDIMTYHDGGWHWPWQQRPCSGRC